MPPYVVVQTTMVAIWDLIRKVHGPLSKVLQDEAFVSNQNHFDKHKSPSGKGQVHAMGI